MLQDSKLQGYFHDNFKPHKIIICIGFICILKIVLKSADNVCCCSYFNYENHAINVCSNVVCTYAEKHICLIAAEITM
jgi:hypothetical protein